MELFITFINLFFGMLLLYFGGDFIVSGSTRLAKKFRVSKLVIGLTIVAFGTSLPELVVTLAATFSGSDEIAIGNIIGSNIANIGLIIGLTCTIFNISISSKNFKNDLNIMIFVSFVFLFFLYDSYLSRFEGMILFFGIIFYLVYKFLISAKEKSLNDKSFSFSKNLILISIGILALYFGSNLFVDGSISLARNFGISESIIGVTIVSYGTSLPELATSLIAGFKKEGDISIGNIIGSNLFNLMGVLGPVTMISPLLINLNELKYELVVMFLFSFSLYFILFMKNKIYKTYSTFIFIFYIIFIVSLFVV